MRFERIPGPARGLVSRTGGRPAPPPRPARRLDEPAVTRPAARPERPHVHPLSYVGFSLVLSFLLFVFFLAGDRGFLQVRKQRAQVGALQAMADGFLLCNADDRVVAWNERYLAMYPWLRPVIAVGVRFGGHRAQRHPPALDIGLVPVLADISGTVFLDSDSDRDFSAGDTGSNAVAWLAARVR